MNKKKNIAYSCMGMLGIAGLLLGTNSAYAFGGFGKNATPEEIAERQTEMFNRTATFLGIGIDEVKNAWAEGKNLKELAKEKGISEETLKAKVQAERENNMKTHLNTLVSKGVITQAQADKHMEVMKNRIQNQQNNNKSQNKGMDGMGRYMF